MARIARIALRDLFDEANALKAREHSPEEIDELRARAPAMIKDACDEYWGETRSFLSPEYCAVCGGCAIGQIITASPQ